VEAEGEGAEDNVVSIETSPAAVGKALAKIDPKSSSV
jgi:hypothetical protein